MVRHTRADEEAGRLELVGSAAVGRQAPLIAALLAAVTTNVAIALLTCLWLLALKLPLAGSAALALSIGGCGLAFAGVAAVGAQLATTARGARGIAIAALGAAFVLRAVGDTGPAGLSWLSWVSPLGWVESTRAFGSSGERWWALALPLAASAALVAAAFALAAGRDYSAGLVPARPGRPASGLLRGPFGLAWRLRWGPLAAWVAGCVFAFAACGAAAKAIDWGLSHISVAVGGACLLLATAGLSYGTLTRSVSTQVPRLLGAAAARLPATMTLAAVAILLSGLLPWEATGLAWSAVALAGVIMVFGPPLQWPAWTMDISPFTQTPKLPGGTVSAQPPHQAHRTGADMRRRMNSG